MNRIMKKIKIILNYISTFFTVKKFIKIILNYSFCLHKTYPKYEINI